MTYKSLVFIFILLHLPNVFSSSALEKCQEYVDTYEYFEHLVDVFKLLLKDPTTPIEYYDRIENELDFYSHRLNDLVYETQDIDCEHIFPDSTTELKEDLTFNSCETYVCTSLDYCTPISGDISSSNTFINKGDAFYHKIIDTPYHEKEKGFSDRLRKICVLFLILFVLYKLVNWISE